MAKPVWCRVATGDDSVVELIWSLRSRVSASDATYLALATVLDAPLVTTDRKLAALPGSPCTVEVP